MNNNNIFIALPQTNLIDKIVTLAAAFIKVTMIRPSVLVWEEMLMKIGNIFLEDHFDKNAAKSHRDTNDDLIMDKNSSNL